MKIMLLSLLMILQVLNCFGQLPAISNQESLFSLMPQGLGGFGGPQFKMTQVNGKGSMIGGGPLAVVVRPDLKWLASFNYVEGGPDSINFWYAGVGGEYSFFIRSAIELNLCSRKGYTRTGARKCLHICIYH